MEAFIGFVLLLRHFDLFGICDIRGNIGSAVYIRTKAKYVNHLSSNQSTARKQLLQAREKQRLYVLNVIILVPRAACSF